ncbi:hypothetical protein NDU88_006660 [Pleurodeles waltl]|uniref:Uncharacterized protein n=1 Tax=Pleurodeles waltl TaxID=8319 RepID=A0AAV7WGZ9_PLEWA|nr:hypothetical protein NDU88_006660 [Pleurodeles waltl]
MAAGPEWWSRLLCEGSRGPLQLRVHRTGDIEDGARMRMAIDALCIDVGHLREEHKKDCVASTEGSVAELRSPLTNATQQIKDLQKEAWAWLEGSDIASRLPKSPSRLARHGPRGGTLGGTRRTRTDPTAEQASMEREQARAEVERRVGSPASSVRSEER